MKSNTTRILVCFMLYLTFFTGIYAQATTNEQSEYDIKQYKWGDSKAYVISKEGTPLHEGVVNGLDATYIAYETTAVG